MDVWLPAASAAGSAGAAIGPDGASSFLMGSGEADVSAWSSMSGILAKESRKLSRGAGGAGGAGASTSGGATGGGPPRARWRKAGSGRFLRVGGIGGSGVIRSTIERTLRNAGHHGRGREIVDRSAARNALAQLSARDLQLGNVDPGPVEPVVHRCWGPRAVHHY